MHSSLALSLPPLFASGPPGGGSPVPSLLFVFLVLPVLAIAAVAFLAVLIVVLIAVAIPLVVVYFTRRPVPEGPFGWDDEDDQPPPPGGQLSPQSRRPPEPRVKK